MKEHAARMIQSRIVIRKEKQKPEGKVDELLIR